MRHKTRKRIHEKKNPGRWETTRLYRKTNFRLRIELSIVDWIDNHLSNHDLVSLDSFIGSTMENILRESRRVVGESEMGIALIRDGAREIKRLSSGKTKAQFLYRIEIETPWRLLATDFVRSLEKWLGEKNVKIVEELRP